jgi:hypothetical protein
MRLSKPACPICGGEIHYKKLALTGSSSSDSSLFGGKYEKFGYVCKNPMDWCEVGSLSYFAFASRTDNDLEILQSPFNDWRTLLKRYHHYVEFAIDNNLKLKLQAFLPGGKCFQAGNGLEEFISLYTE